MEVEIGQFGVDYVYCLHGVKDADVFIVYVAGKGLRVINYDQKRIEQVEIEQAK